MHPSKSVQLHRNCFRISSQEPRRPRFSFFHLHNFKELTSLPSRARTSLEASLPNSFREHDLMSGCPADRLPFQKALNSGSGKRSASSTWRVVFEAFSSVNTLFSFFVLNRNSKTRNRKFLFDFSGLLLCLPPFGAALFSDERVIGATLLAVNPPKRQNRHFLILPVPAVWKTRLNHQ